SIVRRSRSLPRPRAAAEQSADAREEDRQLRRLRQIIVGARRESLEDVVRAAACREDEHWDELPLLAELGDDREAVLAREHDVEHDEIERRAIGQQARDRLLSGVDDLGVEAFGLEIEPQAFGEVVLVFDDEDASAHACAIGRSSVNVLPRPWPALSANAR